MLRCGWRDPPEMRGAEWSILYSTDQRGQLWRWWRNSESPGYQSVLKPKQTDGNHDSECITEVQQKKSQVTSLQHKMIVHSPCGSSGGKAADLQTEDKLLGPAKHSNQTSTSTVSTHTYVEAFWCSLTFSPAGGRCRWRAPPPPPTTPLTTGTRNPSSQN